MIFWRRRNDGFDWHKHVRTTVRLKRADRRRRIDEAKAAAVNGLKDAGRAGIAAGSSSVALAGDLTRSAASRFADMLRSAGAAAADAVVRFALAIPPASRRASSTMWTAARTGAIHVAHGARRAATFTAIAAHAAALATMHHGVRPFFRLLARMETAIARRFEELPWPEALRGSMGVRLAGLGVGGVAICAGFAAGGWAAWQAVANLAAVSGLQTFSTRLVEGRATAVAGDVLRIGETVVRLAGVEAPERAQRCTRPGNRRWRCGESAHEALARLVRGTSVQCAVSGSDEQGRSLGRCQARGKDIAESLVRDGHVFAAAGMFAPYAAQEKEARAERLGLWRGEAERPSEYHAKAAERRQKAWDEAKRTAPGGCPIKGQVIGGRKVYVMPGADDYERIRVRAHRGERWFCTEQEASAAGWRASPRS